MSRPVAVALTAVVIAGTAVAAWNSGGDPFEPRPTSATEQAHTEAAEAHKHGEKPVPTLPPGHTHNDRIVGTAPDVTNPAEDAPVATADPADITGTVLVINGTGYIPCPAEDYEGPTPCFWDAGARGNGIGVSFIWDGVDEMYLEE